MPISAMATPRGAWRLAALVVALWAAHAAATDDVPIATFDGAPGTALPWETVNDPVMGGRSDSAYKEDLADKVGIWAGEVKIVPFLGKPGFCTLQAPGFQQQGQFPDLSGTTGMVVQLAQSIPDGLMAFSVQLRSKGTRPRGTVYTAAFNATTDMEDHFVPWTSFECSWRGQPVSCPDFTSQLDEIAGVGLSTYFPGTVGKFNIQMKSIFARGDGVAVPAPSSSKGFVRLENFELGKPLHMWHTENDPVMGGQSDSTFAPEDQFGDYQGTCRIVPKLQAPGFTIVMTENPLFASFPDVSSMDGLSWRVRNVGGNVTNFKVAFCSSRMNWKCQFASFKASLSLPQETPGDYAEIFMPWSTFSNKWDPKTGKHTDESPPTGKDLSSITQLQLWVEGEAGDFHLHIASVDATLAPGQKGLQSAPTTDEEIFV